MMKYIRSYSIIPVVVLYVLLSASCSVDPVEIGEVEKVKFLGVKDKKIDLEITLPVKNPNNIGFKITRMEIHIISDGDSLGEILHKEKIKIPANDEKSHTFFVTIKFPDFLSGGLSLLKLYATRRINLKLEGEIEARSFLIKKVVKIKEDFVFNFNKKEKG